MATTAKTLTTKQVIAGFNVGHMTVYNWRKGTASQDKLPTHVDDAGKVSFKLTEIVAWAKKYERPFDATQVDAAPAAKPGPKPKTPAVKAAKAENAKRATKAGKAQADAVSNAMEATKAKVYKGMSKTNRKIAVAAKKASRSLGNVGKKSRAQIVGETNAAQPAA